MTFFKDPVCGMPVPSSTELRIEQGGRTYGFCSDFCRRSFSQDPTRYTGGEVGVLPTAAASAPLIAYFSMEVGIDARMPTYAGGLGILAGDTLRSFADLGVPVIGVTLLHRKGYFEQRLDESGNQQELPAMWEPSSFLTRLPVLVDVSIEGRPVVLEAWRYDVVGVSGHHVPLIFLDSGLRENTPEDRELTSHLYGGDERYRLAQEVLLGVGGVRMLRALGHTQIARFHMNEGHSSLLAVELLREEQATWDFGALRNRCVFTTHTPVPAGHDQFDYGLVRSVLGQAVPLEVLQMLGGRDRLNMTLLGLNVSSYVNGVAKKHQLVSQEMFPGYPIDSITNGVHSRTWTGPSLARLYDRQIPGWAADPASLRHAMGLAPEDLWSAHTEAKSQLIAEVNARTGGGFKAEAFTLAFARRATLYKRADLILSEPDELARIAREAGPLQIVFAGKAHPHDEQGKELIRKVVRASRKTTPEVRVRYLENYDIELARLCTSGADLWLNTPVPPLEASGTSGMKAAHNGVPSLSVLDGWWLEGCIEGVTGWSIAGGDEAARDLYGKLRHAVAPLFYRERKRWVDIMRNAIAINASYFNTHRMVQQYVAAAYSWAGGRFQ